MRGNVLAAAVAVGVLGWWAPAPVEATDGAHRARAREMIEKGSAYLRSRQDAATGGWSVPPAAPDPASARPHLPAITALVVSGMLPKDTGQGPVAVTDEAVRRGVAYILSHRQADGGIYDRMLPSYNTSIALAALARVDTEEARRAIGPAQQFLRSIQWGEATVKPSQGTEAPQAVERSHPFYGGVGYGNNSRPDLSNLSWYLEGMHASGVPADDPAFERALVFLQRTQMVDAVNDMPYADGSRQGGFIYATGPKGDQPGVGQSFAGEIEETLDDGTTVSRLRAYGSMTYAGFKSYLYAGLTKEDPRVLAALGWLQRNYTLAENPGLGTDGMYYYFVTMARAMAARGEPTITLRAPGGLLSTGSTLTHADGEVRDWGNDLVARLAELQAEDGSFRSVDDRWMENNPELITAYALIALRAVE